MYSYSSRYLDPFVHNKVQYPCNVMLVPYLPYIIYLPKPYGNLFICTYGTCTVGIPFHWVGYLSYVLYLSTWKKFLPLYSSILLYPGYLLSKVFFCPIIELFCLFLSRFSFPGSCSFPGGMWRSSSETTWQPTLLLRSWTSARRTTSGEKRLPYLRRYCTCLKYIVTGTVKLEDWKINLCKKKF